MALPDQLAYISKEQAKETVAYFEDNNINEVVLWCACCENNPKIKVSVTRVYYKYTGYENYYQVYITGTAADGRFIEEGIDLAYVHIKKNKKWKCLGKVLKYDCDPCTKSFTM